MGAEQFCGALPRAQPLGWWVVVGCFLGFSTVSLVFSRISMVFLQDFLGKELGNFAKTRGFLVSLGMVYWVWGWFIVIF